MAYRGGWSLSRTAIIIIHLLQPAVSAKPVQYYNQTLVLCVHGFSVLAVYLLLAGFCYASSLDFVVNALCYLDAISFGFKINE